ncbi:hypothetical protein [Staphylococcus pettenkoferi]|uniref:hypothetical protein n=1 Tax=Staphylococcus pettenkoferi TaxID=170573 RepID=UPI0011A72A87|nr:hypothetical protein [Staphylococcus pettenkoferi]
MEGDVGVKTMKLGKCGLRKDEKVFVVEKHEKVHKGEMEVNKGKGEVYVKKGLKGGEKVRVVEKEKNGDR